MKIGIMLRHFGQHGGGVLVYTHNLIKAMLDIQSEHKFVLLYKDPDFVGTFADYENATEELVESSSIFLWDQLAVWNCHKQHQFDVIFNPKYSVPLLASCPTVFVCHGLDWYVMPSGSKFTDRINHRFLIPWYARKAAGIVAVSDTARTHLSDYLNVDPAITSTAYLGVEQQFLEPVNAGTLSAVHEKYELPKKYFFYCGQIYPPKNFGRLVEAFAKVGPSENIELVVAGTHTWLCDDEIELIDKLGLSEIVHMLGWVGREELPALYASAQALLLPSLYEACPSPILEAMATSCPIVTSDRYGTKELAGDAAILVNPDSVDSIAGGMYDVIRNHGRRKDIVATGQERIKQFSWDRCAAETLSAIEAAAQ
jgi:glycosyltransferase involved in cell wall biosynthesis